MDLRSGQLYWAIKNGLIATYPALEGDARCEIAVIGGGITGALVAHHLCAAGLDVVLLDKRDIAHGSTAATTGLLQYEIDVPLHELVKLIGEEEARRAYLLCLGAIDKLDRIQSEVSDGTLFQRRESLFLASRSRDVKGLRREYEARRAAGIHLDFFEESEITARYSFSAPAALYSYAAAQVDAYRLTHQLLAYNVPRGLRVYDRTEVTDFDAKADGVTLTLNRGGTVRAGHVVFATGYESAVYLKEKVVDLKSTYALVSEPLTSFDGWEGQPLIWETAMPYFYLRSTPDGRALMGGEDDPFRNPTARDARIGRKTKKLEKRFREMFPTIPLEVAYRWAGTFGETKDGLAYIGATDEFPNASFALGFGGNGITFSVLAAEIIRDALTGVENPHASLFRFGR